MSYFKKFVILLSVLMFIEVNYLYCAKEGYYYALHASDSIDINSDVQEKIWKKAQWYNIDHLYLGNKDDNEDFYGTGRFKAIWDGSTIYLLVEVKDKNLTNSMQESFDNYWQGDCVEIFINESHQCGNHQYNNNAFAYHAMYTGKVIDIDSEGQPQIFPDTIKFKVTKISDNKYIWKMALTVYSEKYDLKAVSNKKAKVKLFAGKKMGFTIAYCDNDGDGFGRKSFYGSTPEQGDSGYVTSDNFGTIELLK